MMLFVFSFKPPLEISILFCLLFVVVVVVVVVIVDASGALVPSRILY